MARRIPDWRAILLAGAALAVLLACVGFALDRSAYGVPSRKAVPYQRLLPTPFEVGLYLESDHSIVVADGDEDIWYFASAAVLVLTLGGTPLLRARQAAGRARR